MHRSDEGHWYAEEDEDWWHFGWSSCMKLLSNEHKSSLSGVYHLDTKMVRILEVILGEIGRQLIVHNVFK